MSTPLTVTVDGDATRPPAVQVPGAAVRLTGQESETSIVNGASSHQTRFVYSIVPRAAGALDVPAIAVATPTGTQTTNPLHATVGTTPATATAQAARASAASAPATVRNSAQAFVTLDVPAKHLVVGQAVPVTIRAYFRAGTSATLDGAPHLTSDAFTLSDLSDKPAQTQVTLHGEPYLAATWTGVLAPAKPSSGKLVVELPVELAYRAAPRAAPHRSVRDLFGSDPFGDAFGSDSPFGDSDPFGSMDIDLDSMFDIGPLQQEQVTLRGRTASVTVTDVPAAGRPAGFAGAVGHFAIAVDPPTGTPRVGEPLTLAMHVTGTGNFDRVTSVGVGPGAGYQVYGDKSDFVPGAKPLTGTKTFTQTIVPTKSGALALPSVAFAFYDPAKHGYVVTDTAPLSLQVADAPGGGAADPGLAASVRGPGMVANRIDPGPAVASLMPRYRRASTWLVLAGLVLAAMLAALVAWARRSRRVAAALGARRTDREVERAATAMKRATEAHDRAAFFGAARTALQVRLGATWHTPPEAITAFDVTARLGARGETIREVFEHADGVAYGADLATEPLEHWHAVVRSELAHLEVSP